MQSVIYAIISESDLLKLFGVGENRFRQWIKQGLPVEADGRFLLTKVLRWREECFRFELSAKMKTGRLNQKELVALIGLSRQSLVNWGRAGLQRNADGTYSLQVVVRWLQCHYQASAEKKIRAPALGDAKKIGSKYYANKTFSELSQLLVYFAGGAVVAPQF